MPQAKSFAVVGAGIIGAAVSRELLARYPEASITIVEKEHSAAAHQTGHNSGVVHAGLYYEPGGLKAKLCRRGVELLKELAVSRSLPYEECGKLVVALDPEEEQRLENIFERAQANGVPGISMLGPDGIKAIEPNATGRMALHSPGTAIISYAAVTDALIDEVRLAGGDVRFGCTVERIEELATGVRLHTSTGQIRADHVIVCAGSQSDRLARGSGASAQPSVVPFFGQYFQLEESYRTILNGLVYPVPDPKYPFLGVHLTKRVDGQMMVGPNAFLSLSREKYRGLGLDFKDLGEVLANTGFWKFAARNMPTAVREARTVISEQFFLKEAAKYVPSLEGAKATRLTRGIRAQAMDADGKLLDDFAIDYREHATHIRNAPSPGATSSLAIAEYIVDSLARKSIA
ncbi:L-2-hydroxyglutarate oxidase [Glutamicibacter protophormiae]|uniref:L-2-hydroxyglutarate oxidase n=1 Tax=Glutamicibacter protophormiae TaxID=37930 RepID=UPI003BAE9D5E